MGAERYDSPIGANDPPPVHIINPDGASSFLLTGDHAGRAIPAAFGTLGLAQGDLDRHIAWDIGVAGLGRRLAHSLDAPFIEQVYSRLFVDCNRAQARVDAIPAMSDATRIPANGDLDAWARAARFRAVHDPYHAAIDEALAARRMAHRPAILIALHSFTPVLGGIARPWDIGILHDGGDAGFARLLLARLGEEKGIVVGDNVPYQMDDTDHSVPRHAYASRLPYAELEIRQDRIGDGEGQDRWTALLAAALNDAQARMEGDGYGR